MMNTLPKFPGRECQKCTGKCKVLFLTWFPPICTGHDSGSLPTEHLHLTCQDCTWEVACPPADYKQREAVS